MTVPPGHSRNLFVKRAGAAACVALVLFLGCAAAGAQEREFSRSPTQCCRTPTPSTG